MKRRSIEYTVARDGEWYGTGETVVIEESGPDGEATYREATVISPFRTPAGSLGVWVRYLADPAGSPHDDNVVRKHLLIDKVRPLQVAV